MATFKRLAPPAGWGEHLSTWPGWAAGLDSWPGEGPGKSNFLTFFNFWATFKSYFLTFFNFLATFKRLDPPAGWAAVQLARRGA